MNVVLVHGAMGLDHCGSVDYFRGVAGLAAARGFRVASPSVDATRGVKWRAEELTGQIEEAFRNGVLEKGAATHLIAHSTGGLDCRWMLTPGNRRRFAGGVQSLTTIGTPHRGSPVADALEQREKTGELPAALVDELRLEGAGGDVLDRAVHRLGLSLEGMTELTAAAAARFNAECPDAPEIEYHAEAGIGRSGGPRKTARRLALTYRLIRLWTDQENDGLVPVSSALWGPSRGEPWPADHGEEAGHDLDTSPAPPAFDHLSRYQRILDRCARSSNLTG